MQAPVMVMNTNSKRESGRKAQLTNIQAAKVHLHFRRLCLLLSTPPLLCRLSLRLSLQHLDLNPCSRCCSIPWEESLWLMMGTYFFTQQCYLAINWCSTPCCQECYWISKSSRWGGGRWHNFCDHYDRRVDGSRPPIHGDESSPNCGC